MITRDRARQLVRSDNVERVMHGQRSAIIMGVFSASDRADLIYDDDNSNGEVDLAELWECTCES